MKISVTKILQNDTYEIAKFAFAVNQDAIEKAFAGIGILVNSESDLKILSDLHDRGGDQQGEFKNANRESIVFDFKSIIDNAIMNDEDHAIVHKLNLIWD